MICFRLVDEDTDWIEVFIKNHPFFYSIIREGEELAYQEESIHYPNGQARTPPGTGEFLFASGYYAPVDVAFHKHHLEYKRSHIERIKNKEPESP